MDIALRGRTCTQSGGSLMYRLPSGLKEGRRLTRGEEKRLAAPDEVGRLAPRR